MPRRCHSHHLGQPCRLLLLLVVGVGDVARCRHCGASGCCRCVVCCRCRIIALFFVAVALSLTSCRCVVVVVRNYIKKYLVSLKRVTVKKKNIPMAQTMRLALSGPYMVRHPCPASPGPSLSVSAFVVDSLLLACCCPPLLLPMFVVVVRRHGGGYRRWVTR